jgi:uncharacterized protein (DUF849 family)
MKRKVVLTCAVTGNAPVHPQYPFTYPVTPPQIAAAVLEAAQAGASVAHIHVRDPGTGHGSSDPALFREVVDRVRNSGVDIVINLTAGHGALLIPDPDDESRAMPGSDIQTVERRIAHLKDCLPEIASIDVTTGNQVEAGFEFVYMNTTRTLRSMAKRYRELAVKPELEAFQMGDVLFANQLVAEGLIDDPPLYQFVLGVKWAAPATAETMLYMRSLLPPGVAWAAFGIGRFQMPMAAQSVLLGGNVRVGLEDNLYLERGKFATNGQLVERARRIIQDLGEDVATPGETRQLLKLKGGDEDLSSK